MINIDNFIKRLQKVMDFYGESPSSFAEKIGVQRSSISHILSGRNKPSLDFILKILSAYPEVELYWLINGKGNFPSDLKTEIPKESEVSRKSSLKDSSESSDKSIERIIIFYSDGSFKNFDNL
jgi:transcriptional regulator with XRE-family HTH domain